ncbi:MAG TPA: anti-sigma factor domain-containing protein, partial [Fusibacter sp.]|nr:anti-sigma factor domain-containing protein [Fusibacter sp.]
MIKGMIIELHENYGVILTDEGLFLKIKRFGPMMEGQPVYLTEEDIIMENKFDHDHIEPVKAKTKKLNTAFLGIIAASMLIIAISATWFFATANSVYTAVIVDINPSIELDLNKNNKVVKLIALNDDALDLDLAALKGMQIDDAIELLVSDAGAKGYFIDDDGYYVLVTTVPMKDQSVEALQAKLLAKFEDSDVLQRTSLALTSITPAQLDLAKQNKVPAGLVMVASSGSDTTVKEFFKIDDNVKAFEDSGIVLRGAAVDSVTSATTSGSD